MTDAAVESRDDDGGTAYSVRVRYTYRARGIAHDGNTITVAGSDDCPQSDADAIVARVRSNPAVRVYFDPEAPSDSALVVGESPTSWFMLTFGVGWLIMSLAFLSVGLAHGGVGPGAIESVVTESSGESGRP